MEQLSLQIQELRKSKGMSQEVLANHVGVSRQAISKWERGEALPDLYNIAAIAEVFNVSIDYLMGRESFDEVSITHNVNKASIAMMSSLVVIIGFLGFISLLSLLYWGIFHGNIF